MAEGPIDETPPEEPPVEPHEPDPELLGSSPDDTEVMPGPEAAGSQAPAPGEGPPPSPNRWWWVIGGLAVAVLVVILLLISALRGDDEPGASTSIATVPETTAATIVPETTVAETTVPETTVPATSVPATTVPATTVPETTFPQTTVPQTTAPEATVPDNTAPPREALFSDGTHLVGEDIEAGIYETGEEVEPFGCYWERLSGVGGTFDEIIANGNTDFHEIVEVMDSDEAFSVSGCGDWYQLEELEEPADEMAPGTWAVGFHIEPGTYRSDGGESCYWARLAGFSGELDDVIANDLPSGQAIVEIDDDDAGFRSAGCGTWVPVP